MSRSKLRTREGWRALDRIGLFGGAALAVALVLIWPRTSITNPLHALVSPGEPTPSVEAVNRGSEGERRVSGAIASLSPTPENAAQPSRDADPANASGNRPAGAAGADASPPATTPAESKAPGSTVAGSDAADSTARQPGPTAASAPLGTGSDADASRSTSATAEAARREPQPGVSTAGSGAGDAASAGTDSQRAPSTAATASVGTDTRTGMTDSADTGTGSTQDNARGDEPERRPPTVLAQADNNLIDRAKEALTSGKSAATGAARSATESAQKAGEAIVDGAGRALDSAGSAASRGLEAAKSGAESLAGKAREAGGRAIDKTIEAGGAAAQAVAEGAGKAASSAKSAAGEAAASASRAVDRLREEAAPDRRAAPIEAAKPDSAKKPGAAESPGTGATPASGSRSAVDTPPPTEQASGGGTIGPLATLGPNLRSGGSGPAASSKSAAPESARPADGGKEAAKSAVTSANDRQIREPVVRLRCAELDVGVELTFGTGAQALGEREQAQLRAIAGCAKRSGSRLEIGGHTDSQGDSLENLLLSVKRAETVAESLSALGVTADKLSPRGYGESQPRADNFTAQGRALNRRVTIRRLQG